jgi:hypothetical protein
MAFWKRNGLCVFARVLASVEIIYMALTVVKNGKHMLQMMLWFYLRIGTSSREDKCTASE